MQAQGVEPLIDFQAERQQAGSGSDRQATSRREMRVVRTVALVALLALGLGLAHGSEFPQPGELLLLSSADLVVVGAGTIDQGGMHIELLEGYSGRAYLLMSDRSGKLSKLHVEINRDGALTLLRRGTTMSLEAALLEAGIELRIAIATELSPAEARARHPSPARDERSPLPPDSPRGVPMRVDGGDPPFPDLLDGGCPLAAGLFESGTPAEQGAGRSNGPIESAVCE